MGSLYKERMRADLWNLHYAAGTEVLVGEPGAEAAAVTHSPAFLQDGVAVVILLGVAKFAPLSSIRPKVYNFTPLDKAVPALPIDDLLDRCPEI